MHKITRVLIPALAMQAAFVPAAVAADARPLPAKPNVLFIAIDDLKTELGCYGETQVKSPNIDGLAAQGVLFNRAYCQVPVCGASRASLMTSVLPTPNRFKVAKTTVDQDAPGAVTLPQTFRNAGYTTISNGKIFHTKSDTQERSWSETPWKPKLSHAFSLDPETTQVKSKDGRNRIYEAVDVADDAYGDGQTANRTVQDLGRLKAAGQPFFLACGFIRPHMPFYAPKKYWDLYDRSKIGIADNRDRPENAPKGLRGSNEYRSYYFGDFQDNTDDFHRMMLHGYYASTSYADAQVGKVLDELKRLDMEDDTIVVIWGDHGWNLGEHNFWGKHNTLNNAVRVPLIIKVPGKAAGQKSDALVGVYDMFPTLCSLAGLQPPDSVQGRSFVSVLDNPKQSFRDAIYTRYGNGDAVVTSELIYTSYGDQGEMLFDLSNDPKENHNIAAKPQYQGQLTRMKQLLREFEATAQAAKVAPPLPAEKTKATNEDE